MSQSGQTINTRAVVASNDTGTVVFRKRGHIHFGHVIYNSDATVGNRQLVVEIKDEAGNLVVDFHAGAVQAASLGRHYVFQGGVYRETSFVNGEIQVAIPIHFIVEANWTFRVYDSAGISSSDDLVYSFQLGLES